MSDHATMPQSIPSFNATLMGVSFTPKESKDFLDVAELGTLFDLQRNPDNEYDVNAIRVIVKTDDPFGRLFVGHVDRDTAAGLAWYLDHDYKFECKLVSKSPEKSRKHSLLISPIAPAN